MNVLELALRGLTGLTCLGFVLAVAVAVVALISHSPPVDESLEDA